MEISVLGPGRWGTFIAWYLQRLGHKVTIYGRAASPTMQELQETGTNAYLSLPTEITLTTNLSKALANPYLVISINAQGLRSLMSQLREHNLKNKTFILCMKGIEIETGQRLSQIVKAYVEATNEVAVWLGPGHVQELLQAIPNCMVIDSDNEATKEQLIKAFSGELIRFYYGDDLLGNEIGAAAKNIIGIAAGMLDGKKLSSLKGALMARGTREIARLIEAMGGKALSAYGLCHLGDYEATVFSPFSHNRCFGEAYVQNRDFRALAEGYYTVKGLKKLGDQHGVDLPICNAVYAILYEKKEVDDTLKALFLRSLKKEF